MIKFFRRIRQKLINEGNLKRYLLYAIGEIALVVIGILIALQINNWNEFRKDREIEKKVLANLVENMEVNIEAIEKKIGRIQYANKSGQIIFAAIKNSDQNVDTLRQHWHWALVNHANLSLSKAGYEPLKSIGFEIIRNEMLKKEIIKLHEKTYLDLRQQQQWGEEVRPDFDNHLRDLFIMTEGDSWLPRNFSEVAKDHYFYGLINVADQQRHFYERRYKRTLVQTKRVLQLIKDELEDSDEE